jgi:hypothetical protein
LIILLPFRAVLYETKHATVQGGALLDFGITNTFVQWTQFASFWLNHPTDNFHQTSFEGLEKTDLNQCEPNRDAQINSEERRRIMSTTPRQDQNSVVAVFSQHSAAENAIKELKGGGFDIKKLAVVGRDYQSESDVVGFYNTGDRMKYWGKWGAFWGGLWGLLFGAAFLIVPGIGPVVAAGSIVSWIVAALEGAVVVGGLSALGAGLYSLGIPKNSVLKYETSIKAGKFVLVAHGTAEEVAKARDMLKTSGAEQIDSYQPSTEVARVAWAGWGHSRSRCNSLPALTTVALLPRPLWFKGRARETRAALRLLLG